MKSEGWADEDVVMVVVVVMIAMLMIIMMKTGITIKQTWTFPRLEIR